MGNNYLSQEVLQEKFSYEPILGQLLHRTGITKVGKRCGSNAVTGYSRTRVNGVNLLVHRIIWIINNGDIPEGMQVDHIDGNSLNNRIENLRVCTNRQNAYNQSIRSSNRSGCKGVHKMVSKIGTVRFNAMISTPNKKTMTWLGSYETLEMASIAYNAAAKAIHGEYYRKT